MYTDLYVYVVRYLNVNIYIYLACLLLNIMIHSNLVAYVITSHFIINFRLESLPALYNVHGARCHKIQFISFPGWSLTEGFTQVCMLVLCCSTHISVTCASVPSPSPVVWYTVLNETHRGRMEHKKPTQIHKAVCKCWPCTHSIMNRCSQSAWGSHSFISPSWPPYVSEDVTSDRTQPFDSSLLCHPLAVIASAG